MCSAYHCVTFDLHRSESLHMMCSTGVVKDTLSNVRLMEGVLGMEVVFLVRTLCTYLKETIKPFLRFGGYCHFTGIKFYYFHL